VSRADASGAVLHLLPDLDVGGGQVLLLRTLSAMPSGLQHVVCALRDGPLRARFEQAGLDVAVVGRGGPHEALRRTVQVARTYRARLIHTNHTPTDRVVGQMAGIVCRLPVVNTFHGMAPAGHRGDVVRGLNLVLAHTNIRHYVAVSHAVAASYRAALRIRPERMTVVHPGLPPEAFADPPAAAVGTARRQLGLAAGERVLLVVARLVPGKGHLLLLEALRLLVTGGEPPVVGGQRPAAEPRPGAPPSEEDLGGQRPAAEPRPGERLRGPGSPGERSPVRLLVAGDGPERATLERAAERLGVADRVMFLGRRDDVAVLLALADVVVSGSLSEGFPLNVLEAMAAGRPVVAAALPAFDDFVVDGETALVVPHDARALAAAVRAVLGDPGRAAGLAAAARQAARAYTTAATAARLLDVYTSVLRSRPGGEELSAPRPGRP
jgi:glycosyltransferase involved in cell wall biosynthesis